MLSASLTKTFPSFLPVSYCCYQKLFAHALVENVRMLPENTIVCDRDYSVKMATGEKRSLVVEDVKKDETSENNDWIGPMPDEAAKPKKRKGIHFKMFEFSIVFISKTTRLRIMSHVP